MKRPTSRDANGTESQLADLLLYRGSAQLQFWRTVARGGLFLIVVYGVTVIFNVAEILAHEGTSGLQGANAVSNIFLTTALQALTKQAPSIALSVLGALSVLLLLVITTGVRYRHQKQSLIKKLERDHAELLAWWARTVRGVNLERLKARTRAESAQWIREVSDLDAPRRLERLHDIQSWWDEDPLLEDWCLHLIQTRRFSGNLLSSLLTPTAAIVGARLLLLLRGS